MIFFLCLKFLLDTLTFLLMICSFHLPSPGPAVTHLNFAMASLGLFVANFFLHNVLFRYGILSRSIFLHLIRCLYLSHRLTSTCLSTVIGEFFVPILVSVASFEAFCH